MAVIGHGIDIVEVARIEKLLVDPEDDFLDGAFSEAERQLALGPAAALRHAVERSLVFDR